MKRRSLTIILLIVSATSYAQDFSDMMNRAFLITRMVEKFHLNPKPLDDELSKAVFDAFIKSLDEHHTIFLAEDIRTLAAYRSQLDEAIAQRKTQFFTLAASLYEQRLRQNDSLIKVICKTPFNFSVNETIIIADTAYAATVPARQQRLAKVIKWQIADAIAEESPRQFVQPSAQKKYLDSAEAAERRLLLASTTKQYADLLNNAGFVEYIRNSFYTALTDYYDPHTSYMPADEKEEFDEDLGQLPLRFGLSLDENEDGTIVIDKLLAGSSAFKSGMLNTGDKIIQIQEPGKAVINVAGFGIQQIDSVLNTITGNYMLVVVKKPDGTTKQVSLSKERFAVEEDEEDKVQGYVLKGAKNIGYISVPDFYVDWEDEETGVAGCANDVAKEIIKLKKENIQGLILDVRYNGGGSMKEAVELAGIFIDGGPVGMYKERTAKPVTLKDVNSGSVYDGPLLIMVNGYSASAAEMLSGTLQDYNRAIIAGTSTYGKATGQLVLPMDTTVTEETIDRFRTDAYLKVTTIGLYRVNGTTAQQSGVVPDVQLPDVLNLVIKKEKEKQFSFSLSPIESNKYYKPLPAAAKEPLKQYARLVIDTSTYFKKLKEYEQWSEQIKMKNSMSLKWDDILNYKNKEQEYISFFETYKSASSFTVENYKLQKERLRLSEWLTAIDEETKEHIKNDLYIQICYQLVMQLK